MSVVKNNANENSSVEATKQILILLSNCAVCGKKKTLLLKNQDLH